MNDPVNHPAHYGGIDNPYEAIKVIEAWKLGFALGNAVKYISRAGKKPGTSSLEDLQKAKWYLDREIKNCIGLPTAAARPQQARATSPSGNAEQVPKSQFSLTTKR